MAWEMPVVGSWPGPCLPTTSWRGSLYLCDTALLEFWGAGVNSGVWSRVRFDSYIGLHSLYLPAGVVQLPCETWPAPLLTPPPPPPPVSLSSLTVLITYIPYLFLSHRVNVLSNFSIRATLRWNIPHLGLVCIWYACPSMNRSNNHVYVENLVLSFFSRPIHKFEPLVTTPLMCSTRSFQACQSSLIKTCCTRLLAYAAGDLRRRSAPSRTTYIIDVLLYGSTL